MKITPKQYAISLYETTKNVDKFKVEKRIENFVDILKKNNDLSLADKIINEYNKYHRDLRGISKIEVTSSDKLDSETLNKIIQKFKNQIEVEEKIDKSLINGIVIKINDDVLIDGSVRRKLEDLKKSLA
jgi:F-type H+-transporting ATPase subunit delta